MRVLFDHQIFEMQRVGGISRYFFELITELSTLGIEWQLPIEYSENQYLRSLSTEIKKFPPEIRDFLPDLKFRGKKYLYKLKEKVNPTPDFKSVNKQKTIKALKEGNFDVFHPTYYDDYFLEYLNGKPFVLTVHDFTHELYPEFFLKDPYMVKKKVLLENAAHIIAISHTTKTDAINFYNVPAEKITVCYHGNSLTGIPKPIDIPTRYLLYVGGRDTYKNFYFFLRAILPIVNQDNTIKILCTGKPFSLAEKKYFTDLGINERLVHIAVNDAELSFLYQNAIAFVYPSLYEGFGIPILEAFQYGCPVIASNTSSLKEIGGDAVAYFSPKDQVSLQITISSLLSDLSFRQQLVAQGYERVKQFSWRDTAITTKNAYTIALRASIS
ncbi:glycosyltransferase family 1 protein [Cytophagaceae bacterium DM2B3-1]|uniref:Glycosyltransferase family 1 protein n=1 Tax=Xanthocytophaga flava TaxID=3048013 RepID=A0ABT7CF40_9BACT|nr:glycosyltransferase family 1 protein [Xanthocytophaga flavus]MDJ1491707.1 glycosyltransferase family 1 protein [Xanthocytophaga flavus]